MRILISILIAVAVSGCDRAGDAEANESQKKSGVQVPPCSISLTARPIRAKTVGELEKIGTGTLCQGSLEGWAKSTRFTVDGLPLELGTPTDRIYAAARSNGGNLVDTYAGRAIVFEGRSNGEDDQEGSRAARKSNLTSRYWLNDENGKLVGFRACTTFHDRDYKNHLNRAFAESFGPPEIINTIANISWAPELRMRWNNGGEFRTSNDPNTARLDFGKIPKSFAWSDSSTNRKIYRDLVRREDRFSRDDFWIPRMQVSQENCLVDDELEKIITPLLNAGISPDA